MNRRKRRQQRAGVINLLCFLAAAANQPANLPGPAKRSVDLKTPEQLLSKLRECLTVAQWGKFTDVVSAALSKMQGPAYDLIDGPLGIKLALDQKNKQRLRNEFKKGSVDVESKAINGFVEALPTDEAKKAFKDLLGPTLKESPANLDLLINHFSS